MISELKIDFRWEIFFCLTYPISIADTQFTDVFDANSQVSQSELVICSTYAGYTRINSPIALTTDSFKLKTITTNVVFNLLYSGCDGHCSDMLELGTVNFYKAKPVKNGPNCT